MVVASRDEAIHRAEQLEAATTAAALSTMVVSNEDNIARNMPGPDKNGSESSHRQIR